MNNNITIRAMTPDDSALYRALRLKSLAEAPDAFGSTLAAEEAYPALRWRSRLELASSSGNDLPLLVLAEGAPIALAWAQCDAATPSVINLFQMWVDPAQRGQGVGLALLDSVVLWARRMKANAVQLGVASGQEAAVRMYLKAGFIPSGLAEPLREDSPLLSQPMRLLLDPLDAGRRLH
jgi:GNAT superfamily N-acetyltransferase